jgi:NAD(P)-dependent dehydrogenase (short-subunit alcohol dehydrogenase family)
MGQARLKDKVAFITGGAIGIGKAIAKAYAEEGATVVIAARNQANMDQTVSELEAMGATARAVPMDITKEQDVIDAVQKAIDSFGRIDILVNNSGIGGPTCNLWDLSLADWNEIIAVDLTGSMLAAREVLKHMVPAGKGGIIINIGAEGGRSGDGRSGYPMRAGYCCAKMGVIGLTETLARECGPHYIRVNCISAAAVRVDRWMRVMQAKADATGVPVEDVIKTVFKNVSLGRPAEEYELANVAVFLASEESSAMTGQTVVAHCGMHWGVG